MKLNKSKKKKLRLEFERLEGLKYVEGIKNHPDPSWFDWVGYMKKEREVSCYSQNTFFCVLGHSGFYIGVNFFP